MFDPPSALTEDTSRRDRKRRQLADHVAAIAFALFEDFGFEAVTMEQVAVAADIAKGTLYKYFPVKEALLAHRFQHEIDVGMMPLWPALEKLVGFAAQMHCLLEASAPWHEARRSYIPHYVRYRFSTATFPCRDPARRDFPCGARRIFERLCAAGQRRGDVRTDLPAGQLAVMLECMCLGAVMTWLGTPEGNLQAQFDAFLDLALRGVGP